MVARTKQHMKVIRQMVLRHGLTMDNEGLAAIIAKELNEKPMDESNIRKWKRKVFGENGEFRKVRLSEDEMSAHYHESRQVYLTLRQKAMIDLSVANTISIYRTQEVELEDGTKTRDFIRDHEGKLAVNGQLLEEKRRLIQDAHQRAKEAQYMMDRLDHMTGNYVPKIEKPADEVHYHLNLQLFKIGLKNVIRFITPLLLREQPLTIAEVNQVGRAIVAEFSTEEGAAPLLGPLGIGDVKLLKAGDLDEDEDPEPEATCEG